MQQTDKYKLNKPGADDPLSVAPLNENADKIEAAIQTETAALSQRIAALEERHTVLVEYTGDGTQGRVIQTGFTPAGGVYINPFYNKVAFLTPGDAPGLTPAIVEGGVLVPNSQPNFQYNAQGTKYRIILFR